MKYTVTMLALFLSVTSAWTGTLRDNFDDGDFEGWRQSKWGDQTAQWSVKKGEMVCMSQNVCGIGSLLRIGDNTWKDYEFVCQFKIEQTFPLGGCNTFRDPGACIAVHYDDDARQSIDGGVATVGGPVWNTFFFEKAVQENFTALQVGNFVTEGGKWHALRIVASGNNYQMFINNKLSNFQKRSCIFCSRWIAISIGISLR
ncbi:DUF1080 domain-containing protein [Candidatus Poribacteria bacterium]|nr:DUF1080 domain-containing protein [Candidatus Poribacteria bacterium]